MADEMYKKLLQTIEEMREVMVEMAMREGRESEEVVKKSQELDRFLSKYQRLIEEEREEGEGEKREESEDDDKDDL